MRSVIAALAVGAGLALLVVAVLMRRREREDELRKILELPFGEQDVDVARLAESRGFLEPGVAAVQSALERMNLLARIATALERGRVPLRPGEFVLVAAGSGIAIGGLAWLLTGRPFLAGVGIVVVPWLAWLLVNIKVSRRRAAFEQQLPEALGLIAASLTAGHTFLHALDMMVEEADPPIREEFERVLAEVRLGRPLMEAIGTMGTRLDIRDLDWVIEAIRIQQSIGGSLAELLTTLADFMRAREEIRREVAVLTADGRMSAVVLGALPVMLFVVIQATNPKYIKPMLSGWGLIALLGAGVWVALGATLIRRLAKIDI